MNHYHILGKSNAAVSVILENLYSIHSTNFSITIVTNQSDASNLPYAIKDIPITETTITNHNLHTDNKYIIGAMKPSSKLQIHSAFNPSTYTTIAHSYSAIAQTAELKPGCNISPNSTIAPYARLGQCVTINRNVSIGHHTIIGDFSTINPGVNIAGNCHIGSNVTIGIGANIIDGITIGDNTIIGAGSLVTKNIPSNIIAYGSPAKPIKPVSHC